MSNVVGMVCWSCGVATRPDQRFCNACGVALATTPPVASDDTPTDEVPVVPPDPAGDPTAFDEFFDTEKFRVVEQVTPTAEQIGLLVGGDATPPQGISHHTGVTDEVPVVEVPIRWRMGMVVLAALTAVVTAIGSLVTVVKMDVTGDVVLRQSFDANTFTSNSMVAAMIAAGLLLVGAVLAIRGSRFGVGLVGGVGLGVCGLMFWLASQAVVFVDSAKHVLRARGGTYRLHLVLDTGFFVAIAAAVLGGACFLVSLAGARPSGERRAHPAFGAIGALASLVLVVGVMLPKHSGTLGANFSADAAVGGGGYLKGALAFVFGVFYPPVPPIAMWSRLVLLLLVLLGGVLGFLRATRWGLGLVVGTMSIAVWQWMTSAFKIGNHPFGPAGGNPGTIGHPPHYAVTVGVVTVVVAAVAQAAWWWRQVRVRSERAAT